jgi:hypothetical protein
VAWPFGNDDLARAQAAEGFNRRRNYGRMGIDDTLGIKLHEVGLEDNRFATQIQAKQSNSLG